MTVAAKRKLIFLNYITHCEFTITEIIPQTQFLLFTFLSSSWTKPDQTKLV